MKRIYLIIYLALLVCVCLSSCTEQLDINRTDNTISLRAEVENVMPTTRSSEDDTQNYAKPVSNNNIKATVWFSTVQGYFPNPNTKNPETNIPGHYVIDFEGEKAVFPNVTDESKRPRYPIPDESGNVQDVYCVGFYPHEGWYYVEGTGGNKSKATHDITGFEDLMFAPPISGNWNDHFDRQKFLHLLTWLKVCVCATTTEAGNYWGKLKRITLKGVPSGLQINNLSKMQNEYKGNNQKLILTASDVSPMVNNFSPDIFTNNNGIDLGINIQDVGSIFCYPQSSYTLEIVCEKGTVTKDIPLRSLSESDGTIGFPAGMQYVLTLYFHPFNVVEGVCTLNAWDAQNEDLYPNAQ